MSPYLLPDCSTICHFLATVLPELLEDVPLAVTHRLWFQHTRTPRTAGKMSGSGWRRYIQSPRSPDLTPMDFFLSFTLGAANGARLFSPTQSYRILRGKTSNSCDNGRCQHVKVCSREFRAAYCRLHWNWWRPLRTLIVITKRQWFGHLILCIIWL
jgi:hypothetical protein